jgi:hypothetical protein
MTLLVVLPLSACALGDGVAQMVKYVDRKASDDTTSNDARPPAPAAVKQAGEAPTAEPPPASAAPRDEIKVETLPPPER